jgi:shikimate kinase
MKIDSFEYVTENDDCIKFEVTIIYFPTSFAIIEDFTYDKNEKSFLTEDKKIRNLLNKRYTEYMRKNKLVRILKINNDGI